MKPALALSTFVLLIASLLGVTPATAADEPAPVTVTWPEVTRFNPDHTSYEITVSDPAGTGTLVAWWGQDQQVLPHEGTATLAFGHEGHNQFVVTRCPETYQALWECTEVARSAELDVYSRLQVTGWTSSPLLSVSPGGPAVALVDFAPVVPGLTTEWRLVDRADPTRVRASGTLAEDPVSGPRTGHSRIPFTVPEGLATGYYYLVVHMSADTADFGHLEGGTGVDHPALVHVDADPPALEVSPTIPKVYPARDGYLDSVRIDATTNEATTAILEVRDEAGMLVYRSGAHRVTSHGASTSAGIAWKGHDNLHHGVVDEGRYHLTLTATDTAGNSSDWQGSVAVSHDRLRWTTYRHTLSANASLVGAPSVGRCSRLAKRPAGAPRGSLGYYSQSRCTGNADAGIVATWHGIYVPKAFDNRYRWAQVTLDGGPDTPSSRNYLVMGFISPGTGKLTDRRVFRRGTGQHPGARMDVTEVGIFDRKTDRPYLIWFNGLTAGSRYVVRGYTLELNYLALR